MTTMRTSAGRDLITFLGVVTPQVGGVAGAFITGYMVKPLFIQWGVWSSPHLFLGISTGGVSVLLCCKKRAPGGRDRKALLGIRGPGRCYGMHPLS